MTFTPKIIREISSGVFYSDEAIPKFDEECVAFLKQEAERASTRRARLCAHLSPEADHHAMLIAVHEDSVIPPHCHQSKVETMTVIEGQADAVLFDNAGAVSSCIRMMPPHSGGTFSYYMPKGIYHTIFPRTQWYVFIETTQGPFENQELETPAWLPDLHDVATCRSWRADCEAVIGSL